MNLQGWILHDTKQHKINLLVLPPNSDDVNYRLIKQLLRGQVKDFLMIYYCGSSRYTMLNVGGDQDMFKKIQGQHIHHKILKHYNLNDQGYFIQIHGIEVRAMPMGLPDEIKKIIKDEVSKYN